MNTPRLITDSDGNTVWKWDGEAFGNTPPTAETTGAGLFVFNLRFPGQYYDAETGLNYNRFRDFDPSTGRYVESDPLGQFGGQISTYNYVGGNPISFFDPFGLKLCPVNLPGFGDTYLDDSFSPHVQAWIQLNENAGIPVKFTEAFRTTADQQSLLNNPNAITPAAAGGKLGSLHMAGFAFDISWRRLTPDQQLGVLMNAEAAGLSWGGELPKVDVVHFYHDPGGREQLIKDAQAAYKNGGDCGCK